MSLAASHKAWVTKEVGMGGELLPQVVLVSIHSGTSMSEAQGIRKVFPPLAAPSIGDFNVVAVGGKTAAGLFRGGRPPHGSSGSGVNKQPKLPFSSPISPTAPPPPPDPPGGSQTGPVVPPALQS